MIQRKKLNKLIFATLSKCECYPTAASLYNEIKIEHPLIMRAEQVKSYKAFVKVINQFSNIQSVEKYPPHHYRTKSLNNK